MTVEGEERGPPNLPSAEHGSGSGGLGTSFSHALDRGADRKQLRHGPFSFGIKSQAVQEFGDGRDAFPFLRRPYVVALSTTLWASFEDE
jgi:hypothetical protein